MGATTTISMAEYLASSYKPDMDYVDGVLEERNVGEKPHSILQRKLTALFIRAGFESCIYPELRLRVSETRCRVPDLCVYLREPAGPVPTEPPLLAIEILSPEDRMSRIMARCDDYISMGCPSVWILDPQLNKAWVYDGRTWVAVQDALTHPALPGLSVPLAELAL